LVVFDLDGTLVDSRRDLAESANAVLTEYGCRTHSEEAIGAMVGDGAATLVARAFRASGCPQPPDALQRFLDRYNARLLGHTRPYPGIVDVLAQLQPAVTLAVLTNKPLDSTRTILHALDLAPFFGARVIGGDGPLGRKPHPAGLLKLVSDAAVSPGDALMVGDSVVDWETAHAAATGVCLARYGFGFAGFPLERLTPADRVIDRPTDLMLLL
jgi:phosphoglycolate phosphatase